MSNNYQRESGISPVVGVVLMVAISVSLSAVVGLVVFDVGGNQDSNVNAGVEVTESSNGITVQYLTSGNANAISVQVNGTELVQLSDTGESTTVTAGQGDTVSVIGINGDVESVIRTIEADTDTTTGGNGPEVVSDSSSPSASAPSNLSQVLSNMEGDGSSSNPYIIMNDQQLQAMNADTGANYKLGQDIDASKTGQWNSGSGFNPVGTFNGSFNGDGYTIKGITINRPSADRVGVFGYNKGTIKNVSAENVSVTGHNQVGGLVGDDYSGNIQNASTTGTVSGNQEVGGLLGNTQIGTVSDSHSKATVNDADLITGGLVGRIFGGTIQRSYATGDINPTGNRNYVGGLLGSNYGGEVHESFASGDMYGDNWTGGLVGKNSGLIEDSYATGQVDGTYQAGGLVGNNADELYRSYATGQVTAISDPNVGGVLAENDSTISNTYWDTESSGEDTSDGGTGLTTSEMQGSSASSNMSGLGFSSSDKWETVNGDYPVIKSIDKQEQLNNR